MSNRVLDQYGKPFSRNGHAKRIDLSDSQPRRTIRARYDAAQTTTDFANHWAAADALDADTANSLAVRQKLRERMRYELANNAYAKGMVLTHANYVIGTGPKLRMLTGSPGFNGMVESAWNSWCAATGYVRKLRLKFVAKVGDGEGFGIVKTNPRVNHPVQLDQQLIECDLVTTPTLPFDEDNYIDGIKFDEGGNPLWYDVLPYHPGACWMSSMTTPIRIPAEFMLHLFRADRPGQHRGVPEMTPSLNSFAASRRYREAVIAAAETAADYAVIMTTKMPASGEADSVLPMSTLPIDKRMLTAFPEGWEPEQMKAEQPTTTYDSFNMSQIAEQGRPLSMSKNIAACDSSSYNYASGRLDHQTYFISVDVERTDVELLELDPLFVHWFREAVEQYGWSVDAEPAPRHLWDWPGMPHIDPVKVASAREINLRCGATTLRQVYAEDGLDYEEHVQAAAEDYGVTVDAVKRAYFLRNLGPTGQPVKQLSDEDNDGEEA